MQQQDIPNKRGDDNTWVVPISDLKEGQHKRKGSDSLLLKRAGSFEHVTRLDERCEPLNAVSQHIESDSGGDSSFGKIQRVILCCIMAFCLYGGVQLFLFSSMLDVNEAPLTNTHFRQQHCRSP